MTIAVALMLKAPREGEVKTRLAHAIGGKGATKVYRRLVEHQIRQIPHDWTIQIHFTPSDAEAEMRSWLGSAHIYRTQPEGDLGHRLRSAMEAHFLQSNAALVFLGADCPYLTAVQFETVRMLLCDTNAVLIPALDGGYCLLALREAAAGIFCGIQWDTDAVAEETRQRLREAQIEWREFPPLEDVDDQASWNRAKNTFPDLEPGGI